MLLVAGGAGDTCNSYINYTRILSILKILHLCPEEIVHGQDSSHNSMDETALFVILMHRVHLPQFLRELSEFHEWLLHFPGQQTPVSCSTALLGQPAASAAPVVVCEHRGVSVSWRGVAPLLAQQSTESWCRRSGDCGVGFLSVVALSLRSTGRPAASRLTS